MKRWQYYVFHDSKCGGWLFNYADCPGANPSGPYASQRAAQGAASNARGPSPSDYLL